MGFRVDIRKGVGWDGMPVVICVQSDQATHVKTAVQLHMAALGVTQDSSCHKEVIIISLYKFKCWLLKARAQGE